MAKVAAAKRKKSRKGSFTVNRNTIIRTTAPRRAVRTRVVSRGAAPTSGIISTGEVLFLAVGLGLGYLAFSYLTSPKPSGSGASTPGSTTTTTPTATAAQYCAITNEVVERRISGAGCGCGCNGGSSRFNFATESI